MDRACSVWLTKQHRGFAFGAMTASHSFKPAFAQPEVIWLQWVLLHLTDDDIVALLSRQQRAILEFLKFGASAKVYGVRALCRT